MEFPQKLKIELLYDLVIPLLGNSKETKIGYQRDTCTPMFIAALFTITKVQKQLECPSTNGQIRKSGVQLYSGVLFIHEKEGMVAIGDNMDGPERHYSQ